MAVALVLAAGEGRRLGGPKALARAEGRTLVSWLLRPLRAALVSEVVVVTGAEGDAVEAEVDAECRRSEGEELAPVRCVRNENWRQGRTGSLQAGWSSLADDANLLLAPVDHPAVRLVTLDVLLGVFGYAAAHPDVLIPVVEDQGERRRGHPVVLHGRLKADVLALGPDDPLNVFLRDREALEVPVDDEGILLNVDTPADLERAAVVLREEGV